MAVIYYSGNQRTRAVEYYVTVATITAGQTITATINGKVETYTSTTADEPTAAREAVAQFSESLLAELRNFTFSSPADGIIYAVGPADGAPVAISWGGTASSLTGTSASVTALSPADVSDDANYVGGAKPVNGDTLVVENYAGDLKYGLDQFAANTVTLVRRASHTGQIGLPDTNPLGYPEYLPTHFETAATALTVEDGGQGFVRVESTAGSAVTATVTGAGPGTLGAENVEFFGFPASSVLNINGGSVAFCPLTSQTGTAATVRCANAAFRVGAGGTLGTATCIASQVLIAGAYTTYVQSDGTDATFDRASAGTTTTLNDGTVAWRSTGSPGTVTCNSGSTFDASLAPATVSVTAVTINEGGTFRDRNRRVARPIAFTKNGDQLNMVIDMGDGTDTITFS